VSNAKFNKSDNVIIKIGMANIKYTEEQKCEIRKFWLEDNIPTTELCVRFGISPTHLRRLCRPHTDKNLHSFKRQDKKLNEYKVKKILVAALRQGETRRELAKQYNVSKGLIDGICSGKNWPHIFQGYNRKYNTEILKIKSGEAF
jgi:transposase-like protein